MTCPCFYNQSTPLKHSMTQKKMGLGNFLCQFKTSMSWLWLAVLLRNNCCSPVCKVDNHDCDVVQWPAIVRLQHYTLRAKMRLAEPLFDVRHCLFITECVPQTIRCQNHELRVKFIEVEGQDVGIGDHQVSFFKRIIAERAGRRQDSCNAPNAVEADEAAGLFDSSPLLYLENKKSMSLNQVTSRKQQTPLNMISNLFISLQCTVFKKLNAQPL